MISRPRVALIAKRTEQQKLMFAKTKLDLARLNMTEAATLLQAIQELHEANEYLSSLVGHEAEKSLVHAMYRVAQYLAIENQIELTDEDKSTPATILAAVDAQLNPAEKSQILEVKSTEYDRFINDVESNVLASGIWMGLSYKLRHVAIKARITEINVRLAELKSADTTDVAAKQIFDECEAMLASAVQLDNEIESLLLLNVTIKNDYSDFLLARFRRELVVADTNVQALRQLEEAMNAARVHIVPAQKQQFAAIEAQRLLALLLPYENYIEELNRLLEGDDAVASAEATLALKTAYPLYLETNLDVMRCAYEGGLESEHLDRRIMQTMVLNQYLQLLLHREQGDEALIRKYSASFRSFARKALVAIHKERLASQESTENIKVALTARYIAAVTCYHFALNTGESSKGFAMAKEYSDEFTQHIARVKPLSKVWEKAANHINTIKTQLDLHAPVELQVAECLNAYNAAKSNQNQAEILVTAKKLISLCETMTAESMYAFTQMTLANIYCDMAAATLAQSPNDVLARQQAIAFYQKAINGGAVDISVYDALLALLELEASLHQRDHLAKFHRETLAHYQAKRQALLPVDATVAETVDQPTRGTSPSLDVQRPTSPTASVKDKLIAMSIDTLFETIENGGEVSATDAYHYFKRHHGLDKKLQERLILLAISRLDGESVRFANTEVLLDLALGLKTKCYEVPAAHQNNSSYLYMALLKTVVEQGSNKNAAMAALLLAVYYQRRYRPESAKTYYRKAGDLGKLHAHVALSEMHLEHRRYDEAAKELNKIIHQGNGSPAEIQGAHQGLAIVNYLIGMNAAEKNRPHYSHPNQLPVRPIIYFDLDETILLSTGATDAFYADENSIPYASSLNADMNKFFNGGVEMWRDIFAELQKQGFDIVICTARREYVVNACPLYNNFVRQFPAVMNNNRNVIFTNGEDKHPFLSDACRQHYFQYLQRQYCILVDASTKHLREAAAVGMTVINVHKLTEELNSEIYKAFKSHVIETARVVGRDFRRWLQTQEQRAAHRIEARPTYQPQRATLSSSSVMYPPRNRAPDGSLHWNRSAVTAPQRPLQRPILQYDPSRDPREPRRSVPPQQGNGNADTSTADNGVKRRRFGE